MSMCQKVQQRHDSATGLGHAWGLCHWTSQYNQYMTLASCQYDNYLIELVVSGGNSSEKHSPGVLLAVHELGRWHDGDAQEQDAEPQFISSRLYYALSPRDLADLAPPVLGGMGRIVCEDLVDTFKTLLEKDLHPPRHPSTDLSGHFCPSRRTAV